MFRKLQKWGGIAASVSEDLARHFTDFENGVVEFRRCREADTTRLLRETAQFFSEFTPGSDNHYRTLVQGVFDQRAAVTFSTLNYDLFLEHVIGEMGKAVSYRTPASPRTVLLLKPHGSCNFLPLVPGFEFENVRFANNTANLEAPVRPASLEETKVFFKKEKSLAPAIALYAKGKQVLFCPSFVEKVQRDWREEVLGASRVFIIGVHPNPEDSHIWGPLKKTKASLWYVGPEEDAFRHWWESERRRDAHHLSPDFGDAVPAILRMLR